MLILRANSAMNAVFSKIIKVMGQNVKWDGRLVFNNNTLILPGELKSLFFSFDNRKIIGTVIEDKLSGEELDMPSDKILENTMNMVLYVFGKWELLKGIVVKQDYSQINSIFNSVLSEVGVTIEVTGENCRFYKDGIRITYEEIIELVLEYLKPDTADELENDTEGQGTEVTLEDKNKIGLWHKILWKSVDAAFVKEITTLEQRNKSRMGMHFYCTGYRCPGCGEFLHMTVYPEGQEETIDTDEGKVVAARVYACSKCVTFYTPRPDRVIMDGEVYVMDFEEDTVAYSDYLDMISERGDRTCNGNFNRYLSDMTNNSVNSQDSSSSNSSDNYDNTKTNPVNRVNEIFADVNEATDEDIIEAWEVSDAAMLPDKVSVGLEKKLHKEIKKRDLEKKANNLARNKRKTDAGFTDRKDKDSSNNLRDKANDSKAIGTISEDKAKASQTSSDSSSDKRHSSYNSDSGNGYSDINLSSEKEYSLNEHDNSNKNKNQVPQTKGGLTENTFVENEIDSSDSKYVDNSRATGDVSDMSVHMPEANLNDIVSDAKDKNYKNIAAAYERVKSGNYPEDEKSAALHTLNELKEAAGKKEMDKILAALPDKPTLEQYRAFKDKLSEYQGIDNSSWDSKLDEKRDAVELSELREYVRKNNRRPKDRKSLVALADAVDKLDYLERNKKLISDEILEPVRRHDEAKVDSVCDKLLDFDYDESLDAYHDIFKGEILPDIKENGLERIIRRLEGIKKDECRSLIGKLVRDTGYKDGDIEGLYVYDVARMWKRDCDDTDAIIFHNANYCYAPLDAFEYPLMVYDSTRGDNGKKGFLLTPDAMYFGTGGESGRVKVSDIKRLYLQTGLFGKGIYADTPNGSYKIASRIKDKDKLEGYMGRLTRFIGYLKEKPISRNADYLIHEKHEIKCCIRCGHVYGIGNVCPKCGAANG